MWPTVVWSKSCRSSALNYRSIIPNRLRQRGRSKRRFVQQPVIQQPIEFASNVIVMTQHGIHTPHVDRFGPITRGPATGHDRSSIILDIRKSVRIAKNRQAGCTSDSLAAFASCGHRHAAGVDDVKIGRVSVGTHQKPPASQQSGDLLAFVLVDFAAKGLNPKRSHDRGASYPLLSCREMVVELGLA